MKACLTSIKALLTATLFFASNAYALPQGSCFPQPGGLNDPQSIQERTVFTLVEGVLSFFATIDKAQNATFPPPGAVITPKYEWVFIVQPNQEPFTMQVFDLLDPNTTFTMMAVTPEEGIVGKDYILFFAEPVLNLFGANVNFLSRVCSWDADLQRIFKCEAITEALTPGELDAEIAARDATQLNTLPFQRAPETQLHVWQETIKNVFPVEDDAAAKCRAEGREVVLNSRKEAGQAGLLQIPPAEPLAKFNQNKGKDGTTNGNFIQRNDFFGTFTVELTKLIDTKEPNEIEKIEANVTCMIGGGCQQGDIDIKFTP